MYPIHTLATIIPELTDVEFADLKASILKYGQLVPIMLFEGKVIDGRHRQRAVSELREEDDENGQPIFTAEVWAVDWTGIGDPEDWVIETNLNHRNLDAAQKAALAARQWDGRKKSAGRPENGNPDWSEFPSLNALEKKWHSKHQLIELAHRLLQEHGEDAIDRMIRGELDLKSVRRILDPPEPKGGGHRPLPAKGRPSDDSLYVISALEGMDFVLDRFKVTPRAYLNGLEKKDRDKSFIIARRALPWLRELLNYAGGADEDA